MWIELHDTLPRHPKLIRLASKLGVHRAQAAGHLTFLWLWALDYAPTGDLSSLEPAEIAEAAAWPGNATVFLAALKETRWVDMDGQIHHWRDYAGRLIERREKDRLRKGQDRADQQSKRHGRKPKRPRPEEVPSSAGNPPDIQGKSGATGPNLTLPNRTQGEVAAGRTTAPNPEDVSPPLLWRRLQR